MSKIFNEQVAIITGGNSGLGQGIALDLAKKGAKVMVLSRNEEKNKKTIDLIEENGGYGEAYSVDVSDQTLVSEIIDGIYNKHDRIDILISNAGITTPPKYAHDMDYEDWDRGIKVHLYGAFNCVKACAKKMKERGYGRIVLMSSLSAVFGFTGAINYAASKTGIVGMTYTLAKELGPFGITVNAIQPGVIRTPLAEGIIKDAEDFVIKSTPIPRVGEPEDVSHAASFLCDPKSSFITGIVMRVDGGNILPSGMDEIMRVACESQ